MKKMIAVVCLSTVFLAMAPLPAGAGTKTLWPNQCTPASLYSVSAALANSRQLFDALSGSPGNAGMFQCAIKLPVGRTVTRLHVHGVTGGGGFVDAYLQRMRLAGATETVAHLTLGAGSVADWYSATDIVPAYAQVKPGYRYWVTVTIFSGSVQGVKVSYD